MGRRVILLGILLCLYPLGQFCRFAGARRAVGRFGSKPVFDDLALCLDRLLCSHRHRTLPPEFRSACFGFAAGWPGGSQRCGAAQSAIADVITPEERNRFFGYIYLSASSAYITGPLVGGKLADPELGFRGSAMQPRFGAAMIVLSRSQRQLRLSSRKQIRQRDATQSAFRRPSPIFEVSCFNRRLRRLY